jgi:hypothetical protein
MLATSLAVMADTRAHAGGGPGAHSQSTGSPP